MGFFGESVEDFGTYKFFFQEKMLKIQPQALMDREKKDELPSLQIGWIDGICLPLYKVAPEYSHIII